MQEDSNFHKWTKKYLQFAAVLRRWLPLLFNDRGVLKGFNQLEIFVHNEIRSIKISVWKQIT